MKSGEIESQHPTAEDLVGKHVRLANSPKAPVLYVDHAYRNGMIHLLGWQGQYAPHLFVVVEAPAKEQKWRK